MIFFLKVMSPLVAGLAFAMKLDICCEIKESKLEQILFRLKILCEETCICCENWNTNLSNYD